jgi:hypothetical protein
MVAVEQDDGVEVWEVLQALWVLAGLGLDVQIVQDDEHEDRQN